MSNFDFLHTEWPSLFVKVKKAEERVNNEPASTATYCRLVLEECIYHIYDIEYLELPFNTTLLSLLSEEEIKAIIPFQHMNGIHIIRKTGNDAAHYGKNVDSKAALISIRYLFDFLKWFTNLYSNTAPNLPGKFNESVIPKEGSQQPQLKQLQKEAEEQQELLQAQIDKLIAENKSILEKANESEQALAAYEKEAQAARAIIQKRKQQRPQKLSSEFTEAETRKHLIDVDLREAGWHQLRIGREIEFPVKGMPITPDNPKGNGFVDYVLWDDDGKPLALVEAKRTSKDVEIGKHQAFLYANCLEEMFGQRPIIFYTNGYDTKIWEDRFYSAPRPIHGFYTKAELKWHLQQQATRKDIRKAKVNTAIAGRPYQIEAIQRVAENFVVPVKEGFKGGKRNALLVMATGSGKTRTAAALVEVLFKQNWVKRVLFLADRNALVRQAKNSFSEHLPALTSINLSEEKESDTTRLVFSTYQSMINQIDNVRFNEERFYGVGHFDLIIIDEAHRSVYNRYQAIFDYFDGLLVGLTATPKAHIDQNTFEIFGCSDDDPTFSYELEQAVPTYLKPYKNLDVTTKFLREGIKYAELSDEDKARYEQDFLNASTGLFPEEVKANAMNKWLFNKDTVNKVLDDLMEKGLKIEGGDKLGRTIIFAVNQKHAQFIVDCFLERYPEQSPTFIATIHNKISHAQSLIEAFCDEYKENDPQIAVSVDMMDTGIDAPRVLNLVFFKKVRSYAKFWQMIGRGTRLCPDVFGPNDPKEFFLIFDVCQNFEFFEVNKKGLEGKVTKPITQQIFEARLQLSRLLAETGEIENIELANEYLNALHYAVSNLDRNRFQVKMNLRYVDEFNKRERWNNLSADDVHKIELHLSGLPIPEVINEVARRFDLMMLKLQIANLLFLSSESGYHQNLMAIAEALSKKYTIPEVLRSSKLIESMKNPDFYKALSQKRLDEIRMEIRELVKYLEQSSREPVYTNIKDSDVVSTFADEITPYSNTIYKNRVERFLRENKHQLTISKLSTNKPITKEELGALEEILFDGDERGTKVEFIHTYVEQPLGAFVRRIIGLDIEAANQAFSEFLQAGNLKADQMTFISNIINYLNKNGIIDKRMLFEPPFTDINDQGLIGVFDDVEVGRIISIIDSINENAEVG